MCRTYPGVVALLVATGVWLLTPGQALAQESPAAPAQRAEPSEPERQAQPLNVRIDLSISQEGEGQAPETKTVSMVLADGSPGRVRAGASGRSSALGVAQVQLNVDARPRIVVDGLVRLELTVEHIPLHEPSSEDRPIYTATHLNEFLTVHLRSGVPLVVSEAADPVTGRKTTVEVTATVLK